jgi:predicted dehydrogenase
MKFGILGTDLRIAAVAAEAIRRGAEVAVAVDVPPDAWPQAAAADGGRLIDPAVCDAVLVGVDGWSEARADMVRLLVQAGRPLLASHPLELSMLWAWEMEMIRRDAGGVLLPLLPERLHPFISRLKALLEASLAGGGPVGGIESLLLERRLGARGRADVLAAVARDADLVRVLTGDPARLSAIGVGPETPVPAWHALVVAFTGPTSVPVRWQAASGGEPGLRISLQGDRGVAAVEIPADWSRPWTWSEPGQADEQQAWDAPALILDRFEAAVAAAGREPERAHAADDGLLPPATWADAARAIELADAVPRSLTKGRAVDLHQEEFSDLGTFRGTMASLGCGIILAALLLVVLATLVGGVAHEFGWGFGGWLAGTWPFVALAALGGFLVLQLLPLLVAGGGRHE